jgi:uncharacterized membrane protein (UPF0127 family)
MRLGNYAAVDSAFKRMRGLMFRRKFERPLLFAFPQESRVECTIHAFFVFFPFDAIYLDGKKRVVDIHEAIKPFTPLVVPKRKAKYLIEAPAGWARKNRLKLRARITF